MNKKIIVLLGAGLIMLLLLPFFGLVKIDFFNLLTSSDSSFVFWQLRVPRTILGFIAGSSLALAGLIFQNIFKNSLATPYTLGVSTGASAGIVMGIKFHLTTAWLGLNGIYIFGFLGALISITIILGIAKLVKSYSIYTLLMSGVAINFFFSSLIVMVQYLFDFTHTIAILRWLMGGITTTGYRELLFFLPIYFFFIFASYLFKNELLIASAGDEFAFSKGLNIKKFRVLFFILVSLVIGVLVSFVGPIGFVGLIVPHIARLFFKKDFKSTLFFTIIAGGILLALTDFIARILIHPVEIPVGIITSLMGAPFFLFILISSLRKNK